MDQKTHQFKVLIPVWGEKYINLFCDYGLPSLLAEGNLPALSRDSSVKICFLTSKDSQEIFLKKAWFKELCKHYEVVFSYIDNLIDLESYGVVLTYAYAQGISEEPAEIQLKTHFIFLNADFVISDKTFLNLIKYVEQGKSAIVSPSLRCDAETTMQRLDKDMQESGKINYSARHLVRLALNNLHTTAYSKVVNQQMLYNEGVNQLYWIVDSNTIIGRFFLMSMLYIKPEKAFEKVKNYCDYSFIPDLCPSGNYSVIEDSDEVFILEISPKNQENNSIRFGQASINQYAKHLSSWTTKEHRDYARFTLLFHAAELPSSITYATEQLSHFMEQINNALGESLPYDNHPYWTRGANSLKENDVKENTLRDKQKILSLEHFIKKIQYWILGAPPYVRRWHPDWLDYIAVTPFVKKIISSEKSGVLYIRDCVNAFDNLFLNKKHNIKTINLNSLLTKEDEYLMSGKGSICIVHLLPHRLSCVPNIMHRLSNVEEIVFFINGMSDRIFKVYEVIDIFKPYYTEIKYSHCASDFLKINFQCEILALRRELETKLFFKKIGILTKLLYKMLLIFLLVNLQKKDTKGLDINTYYSSIVLSITTREKGDV